MSEATLVEEKIVQKSVQEKDFSSSDVEAVKHIAENRRDILQEISKVIIGQEEVIDLLLIALFSKGHCLFVGVPGLAKTLLINTLANVLNLDFKRIQFTPDLMPSDITGTEILEEDHVTKKRFFKFIKGPIFTNILLADEINRTSPKTQAALLQAMQEYHVSAGGASYDLALPFLVFATQNPIEQEGTYPLPEAQLDRFMFNITVDYPTFDEEIEIVKSTTSAYSPDLKRVLDPESIIALQDMVLRVPASEHVIKYAVNLARFSRPKEEGAPKFVKDWVSWGAGPRACQYLIWGAKARAILRGRYAVTVEDIKALAKPILQHRIIPNFHAEAEGIDSSKVIELLLKEVSEEE
jgi:MoxR-like ATPase